MADNKTVFQAMKAYRVAYHITADLKAQHDKNVAEQRRLIEEISKASATENKAREVMLNKIQW